MGKRLKAAALCCVLAACMVPALTGCSNNKTTYTPETKSPVVASPAIGQDGTLRVGVVSGFGQAGAAPEFRSQLHGVEIGDRLPSVAVQHLYFRKDHNEWNISDKISEKPVNGQLFP